ncbi:MAG: hypothetical protein WAU45_13860 [Blastocatellia bacterium]
MKKQAYIVLVLAALLATVSTSVQAQSDRLIAANVPFNFKIKDRALPAGEYVFALVKLAGSDAIKIQSADGHITAFIPTRSATARQNPIEARLVFNRYEDQYFLAQVFGLEENALQKLSPSRAEKELARAATAGRRTEVSVVPAVKR